MSSFEAMLRCRKLHAVDPMAPDMRFEISGSLPVPFDPGVGPF